ncbi:hypothetical protein E2C01_058891 [Portunus trituberculatus]|uniref:Uncharacterized protein n=1 Tax=Portunus trituberculatus TaxID=210409 RepID=A0A5B7GXL3_PORTR|nr:hypothetical protein [Portunus trituberculatus]
MKQDRRENLKSVSESVKRKRRIRKNESASRNAACVPDSPLPPVSSRSSSSRLALPALPCLFSSPALREAHLGKH